MADNMLDITLLNLDGTQNLYIGSSAPTNQLTLMLTNNSQQAVTFQTFSSQSGLTINSITQSDSAIFLLLNGLVSNSVISQITVNPAPGWLWQIQQDDQNGDYITFYPQYTTSTLSTGDSLTFTISFPSIITSSNEGFFLCQYVNVISNGEYYTEGEQLYISLAYPPFSTGGGTSIPLQFDIVGSNILYNDNTPQNLTLRITNTGSTPLVPQGTAGWDMSNTPLFEIKFVTGGDQTAGVLLNQMNYAGFTIDNDNLYGNQFITPAPIVGSNPYVWQVQPMTTTAGGLVLGTGSAASITLTVTGLRTDMPAGISSVILSYRGIPGYDDGQLTAEIIVAVRPPAPLLITALATTHYEYNISDSNRSQYVCFEVSGASYATLTQNGVTVMSQNPAVDGQSYAYMATINSSSLFRLTAFNESGESVMRDMLVLIDTTPIGSITMWYGSKDAIPYGWGLCDGQSHYGRTTPNLASKFILAADRDNSSSQGGGYYLGQTGGGGGHTHNVTTNQYQGANTDYEGSHTHTTNFSIHSNVDETGGGSKNFYYGDGNETTDATSQHRHSMTIPSLTGTAASASAEYPPYFALYYIMRCV